MRTFAKIFIAPLFLASISSGLDFNPMAGILFTVSGSILIGELMGGIK